MLNFTTIKKLQTEQKKLDAFIIQKKNLTDTDSHASFIRTKIALLVEIGELANELKTFKHWKSQKDIDWEKAKEELIDCFHFYLSWANSLEIDFSDYKFQKLVPEADFNELLLAFFAETNSFSIAIPWNKLKNQMLANFEKNWEEHLNNLEEKEKNEEKLTKRKEELILIKEKSKKNMEKINNSFLAEIEFKKNKSCFYRWLIIFEELAQKLGMKTEKDIEMAYLAKNKKNWERQQQNY
ncbi:MAG: dUTP diphosphatase [Candidatus Moeniiplasma glomeromycotorum]|nr:dUTP diphosphatase [Candidatus Moeniiplasma glomeromycotorum]MCE8169401.1 dUTP diphosphatase [Candidatus Moeniiplasma glomeromycotorum]